MLFRSKPVAISPASTSATVPVHVLIITPVIESSDARGKRITGEPARTEAPKKIFVETSRQEIEEILKIIKKSDYNIVEQLGQTRRRSPCYLYCCAQKPMLRL